MNLTIITSVINISKEPLSYSGTRSIYSPEERFNQTIKTIESLKKINNTEILFIESTNITKEMENFLKSKATYFLNIDETTSKSNSPHKASAESSQIYEGLKNVDISKYEIINENVDCESIEIPSMILQPFIENSIIHGVLPNEDKFGEIYIHLSLDEDVLTIKIEDNGVGVKKSLSSKLEMEGDHKSQGMEITSKRIELLKKVSNNEIELIGPLQIESEDGLINGTRVLIKIRLSDLEN